MKFCNECPLKASSISVENKCIWFGKMSFTPDEFKQIINRNIPGRCAQDSFVVKNLSSNHPLALRLAKQTLEKSLFNNDRPLLLALLLNVSKKLQGLFWQILKENECRSLKILNPIFSSVGIAPLSNLVTTKTKIIEYMNTISKCALTGDI